ncbi:MAG: lipocalin-like domain-containing protein, partial [Gammaproteobacteria bacterium]
MPLISVFKMLQAHAIKSWLCALLLLPNVTAADDTAKLLGSWDLVSLENRGADGSVHHPFGTNPVGRITYTADGLMSAQIMHGSRQPFATATLYG